MEINLINEDSKVVVDASRMEIQSEIIDVTTLSDSWRNYVPSGIKTITIEGKLIDGDSIEATFVLEEVVNHNTFIVGSRLE